MPAQRPPEQQEQLFRPPGPEPLVFDDFTGGLNTDPSRPGIDEKQLFWCDGWFPLGRNNLRTLPGIGPPIYGTIIKDFMSFNVPSSVAANTVITPPIQVTMHNPDSSTNTMFTGPVTMAIDNNPSGGVLSGTLVRNAVAGIATFDDLEISVAGTGYTLIASAILPDPPPQPKTVVWFGFGNIGSAPLCVIALSDGSLVQVNTDTLVQTTIAPAGTILNPAIGQIDVTQWGSQYLLFVAQQPNGYFIWDGSILYAAGGLSPSIEITSGGSGYTFPPTIVATGGTGSGATFLATLTGDTVTDVTITNPGTGYSAGDVITLTATGGGGSGFAGTVEIMPFGIKGNAIDAGFESRVWIVDGAKRLTSAPESFTLFDSADGGVITTSTDAFLRVGYSTLKQTNGFEYFIGDSSISYANGVNTSGSPPVTTMNFQNADPEIGTPYGDALTVFSRNLVLANAFGVHVSYGGAVTKISDNLDGVYTTVPNFGSFQLSAAKAIIFGKKVWMVLVPVIDFVTGQHVNKLFLWDGKRWFSSQQDAKLIFVAAQEINSVLTAYGTDGNAVFPLFQKPSDCFTKTIQSKLWEAPGGYEITKTATRFWMLVNYESNLEPAMALSIDNEFGSSPQTVRPGQLPVVIINTVPEIVPVFNASGSTVTVVGAGLGLSVLQPTAIAQQGTLLGITLSTRAADATIISMKMAAEEFVYRG